VSEAHGSIPMRLTSIRPHAANERSKIVLDRNPLQDIRNSESVHLVVLNGRVLDAKTLNETGEGRQRLPFWWERKY
jgi:hypothetical protein